MLVEGKETWRPLIYCGLARTWKARVIHRRHGQQPSADIQSTISVERKKWNPKSARRTSMYDDRSPKPSYFVIENSYKCSWLAQVVQRGKGWCHDVLRALLRRSNAEIYGVNNRGARGCCLRRELHAWRLPALVWRGELGIASPLRPGKVGRVVSTELVMLQPCLACCSCHSCIRGPYEYPPHPLHTGAGSWATPRHISTSTEREWQSCLPQSSKVCGCTGFQPLTVPYQRAHNYFEYPPLMCQMTRGIH